MHNAAAPLPPPDIATREDVTLAEFFEAAVSDPGDRWVSPSKAAQPRDGTVFATLSK